MIWWYPVVTTPVGWFYWAFLGLVTIVSMMSGDKRELRTCYALATDHTRNPVCLKLDCLREKELQCGGCWQVLPIFWKINWKYSSFPWWINSIILTQIIKREKKVPAITTLSRLRQESCELGASLSNIVSPGQPRFSRTLFEERKRQPCLCNFRFISKCWVLFIQPGALTELTHTCSSSLFEVVRSNCSCLW